MTFSMGNLKFIASFQFMAFSLETLVKSMTALTGDPYAKFTFMKKHFNEKEMALIARKGLLPIRIHRRPPETELPRTTAKRQIVF